SAKRLRWQFFGSAPGAGPRVLGVKASRTSQQSSLAPSLRHVSLRETGWSSNPTSSGRTRPGSKGKATYGEQVRIHAFPRCKFFCATRTRSASQREPAKLSASPPRGTVFGQENEWA